MAPLLASGSTPPPNPHKPGSRPTPSPQLGLEVFGFENTALLTHEYQRILNGDIDGVCCSFLFSKGFAKLSGNMSARNRGRGNPNQDADEERRLWKEIKDKSKEVDDMVVRTSHFLPISSALIFEKRRHHASSPTARSYIFVDGCPLTQLAGTLKRNRQ